jgi:DDE superfamily endonuclease/Helix-turn-helix of DDE superfamily endonuclease
LRYQSTTGLPAELVEELAGRIWQIGQASGTRGWPRCIGLHRAIVVTLILVRQNLSQAAVADLFGISQPTVSRICRRFLPLIGQALCRHVPDLPEVLRGRVILLDGTDVPTGHRAGHSGNFSGKRHRAGLNIQVVADLSGRLLGVSAPMPGAMHDRRAFTETGWEELFTNNDIIADPGYQGTHAITPRKKPKGGELSDRDQASNKKISAIRSAVERCIAHLKNWKVLATGYRGRLTELPAVIRVITALECYRLGW